MDNKEMTHHAQKLRTNATPEENTLWYQYLRKRPVQFRRQHPLGQYIVDFYCAKAKLVIELDGSQHYSPDGQQKDFVRTEYLESLGLQVLRFSNSDIQTNLRGVCQQIDQIVEEKIRGYVPLIRPCGPPSPTRGRLCGTAARSWRNYV